MKTLKELYRIGRGPSSSHTMGPQHAAEIFLERCSDAAKYVVTLYGSLAATGKGHMTDQAIGDVLKGHGQLEIRWEPQTFLPYHPNGMRFQAYDSQQNLLNDWTVFSVGGGALSEGKGFDKFDVAETYAYPNLTEIMKWCYDNGRNYWEYVEMCEQKNIWDYLGEVWNAMKQSISNGLTNEGVLPGPLKLPRKAANYYTKATSYKPLLQERSLIYAYALAVSEENASGGTVVTAPTCGSCGVMPAVLYHLEQTQGFSEIRILRALATGGLIGNVAKQNASISGAEVGCQGEVGVACAMAAAAACQLLGGSQSQIEYAAEMGLEHHLGMTCDPMCGMVQIPCIERNAFAASRAIDVAQFALQSDGHHHVSYDKIVKVMKQTGHDLPSLYKETSQGGMASLVEDI
ncbi:MULTISPECIES: L-serine ammonia-lyase [unclassified Bacteroides]|uniref:L-serine ammonia-lyase n=1 Tax=unclassified Bacteroides TaxID=2646097 RepID=UPI0004E22891|nr:MULTISPECIES: L-serine ammonia-lyase [unclassified Bacteroides]